MIWLIFILVMIASRIVQVTLQNRFEKYSQVPCKFSGAEVAQKMLDAHGIKDVKITCIKGTLTDHYNPVNKTVNLSESVYSSRSIAAAAIAAHECGHVVQHSEGYAPLKLRTALVPVVTLANNTVQWVLLIGILMLSISPTLLYVGIGLFAMTTLFSVITLPVENIPVPDHIGNSSKRSGFFPSYSMTERTSYGITVKYNVAYFLVSNDTSYGFEEI